MNDGENSLEICRLEIGPRPHLITVSHFELPPLTSESIVQTRGVSKEWVPTSKDYARYRSSRGYHSPFYSSAIRSFGLLLLYYLAHPRGYLITLQCTMVISIAALVSAIPTDVRIVPWEDWGPSCTHVFEGDWLRSAGPLWITDNTVTIPLVVRQFDVLRTWHTQSTTVDASSSQTGPPIFSPTEVSCRCWEAGKVKTMLPYRDMSMAYRKEFRQYGWMMADREWWRWVSPTVRGFCTYSNHFSVSLIIRSDRERK
jgi:hypothetical protein